MSPRSALAKWNPAENSIFSIQRRAIDASSIESAYGSQHTMISVTPQYSTKMLVNSNKIFPLHGAKSYVLIERHDRRIKWTRQSGRFWYHYLYFYSCLTVSANWKSIHRANWISKASSTNPNLRKKKKQSKKSKNKTGAKRKQNDRYVPSKYITRFEWLSARIGAFSLPVCRTFFSCMSHGSHGLNYRLRDLMWFICAKTPNYLFIFWTLETYRISIGDVDGLPSFCSITNQSLAPRNSYFLLLVYKVFAWGIRSCNAHIKNLGHQPLSLGQKQRAPIRIR